jgi:hypothetical protein
MYASLLISLLAAFVAMLGKQWLSRYLRGSGEFMIDRCTNRQRKCDGLKKWPLEFFIESLPVMLQVALFLLDSGLCRHMWLINPLVARTLIGLTSLGAAFYVWIVIAGISSYACPFQTPVSTIIRGTPKWVRRGVKRVLPSIRQIWGRPLPRPSSQPKTTLPIGACVSASRPWLEPEALATIHRQDANDARCVSWILRDIIDPEALDAAVRLAETIRWFDGPDIDVPYGMIVSTFEAGFDPSGKLYPGWRDRAYHSGRAMVWIHNLEVCRSGETAAANRFPLSRTYHQEMYLDPDLRHVLRVNRAGRAVFNFLLEIDPEHTPSHTEWVSDTLLHYCWANRSAPNYSRIPDLVSETKTVIPSNATLNRLLVWCIFLRSPPEEEVLMVQNKSYDTSCFALRVTHSTLH